MQPTEPGSILPFDVSDGAEVEKALALYANWTLYEEASALFDKLVKKVDVQSHNRHPADDTPHNFPQWSVMPENEIIANWNKFLKIENSRAAELGNGVHLSFIRGR